MPTVNDMLTLVKSYNGRVEFNIFQSQPTAPPPSAYSPNYTTCDHLVISEELRNLREARNLRLLVPGNKASSHILRTLAHPDGHVAHHPSPSCLSNARTPLVYRNAGSFVFELSFENSNREIGLWTRRLRVARVEGVDSREILLNEPTLSNVSPAERLYHLWGSSG